MRSTCWTSLCVCLIVIAGCAHAPSTRPRDIVATVSATWPGMGFEGGEDSPFRSMWGRPVRGPEDMESATLVYRLTVSETNGIVVKAWADGVPTQVAVVRSAEAASLPDPDLATTEREERAAMTLRKYDGIAGRLVSFEFGQLQLAAAGRSPVEGTVVADALFGDKYLRSWKRSEEGWVYTVSELQLWQPAPAVATPPKESYYIRANRLATASDARARPYVAAWTEVQTWPANSVWWSRLERREYGVNGTLLLRMETTNVRDARPTDPGRGTSAQTQSSSGNP